MDQQHLHCADRVLASIRRYGGRCNMDQLYDALGDYDGNELVYEDTIGRLETDFGLVRKEGNGRYYIALTAEGMRAAETGMGKRLNEVRTSERLKRIKMWLDISSGFITLGNFIAGIIGFTAGILLSDPLKTLLKRIVG